MGGFERQCPHDHTGSQVSARVEELLSACKDPVAIAATG